MKEIGLVGLGGGLTYGLLWLLGNDISLMPRKPEQPKKESKPSQKCGCSEKEEQKYCTIKVFFIIFIFSNTRPVASNYFV